MNTNGRVANAIYARISVDREDDGQAVERQLQDCRAFLGTTDAREFVDANVSASRYGRRPRVAYASMMEAIRTGEVQRVVCWKLDRLYRRPRELEDLIDLAEGGRVQVVAVVGGEVDLNTAQGRWAARGMVAADAKSSDDTSERLRRQKQQARQLGQPHGGPRPFGWADQLTPHPVESVLLLAAMDRVLAGASLNDIAREWTARGVRGRKWGTSDVHRTLSAARHAGLIVHDGEVVGTAVWRPLIDRAMWERVCAAIEVRARGVGVPRRRSMLTGLLRCEVCGATLASTVNTRKRRVWRCDPSPTRAGCGRVSIGALPLERLVVDAVWQYVDGLELHELVQQGGERAEYRALAEGLGDLDRQEDESAEAYGRKAITMRQMEAIAVRLRGERQALRARMARAAAVGTLEPYAGQPGALESAWDRLTDDQRRGIIADAFGVVIIRPATKLGRQFDPRRVLLGRA
jgi:site-specific DNA recombinase